MKPIASTMIINRLEDSKGIRSRVNKNNANIVRMIEQTACGFKSIKYRFYIIN